MPWTSDVIMTNRLTLRCPTGEDWPAIKRILSDPEVRRYLGGPVSSELVQTIESRPKGEHAGLFAAVLTTAATTVGTFSIENEREDFELSYQLLPEYWGKGIAYEAAKALLNWGWERLEINSVIAVTQSENRRSLRLLRRLGFAPDRTFEEHGALQTQMRLPRPA